MAILRRIYERSPVFVQNAFATGYGAYVAFWRKGRTFREERDIIIRNESLSLDELDAFQTRRLAEMLTFQRVHSPYYRDLEPWGWDVRIETLRDAFVELPLLDKQTVRERLDELIPDTHRRKRLYHEMTSGSTGTPLKIVYDREATARSYAHHCGRWRRWAGVEDATPWAVIGSRLVAPLSAQHPPFWRKNHWAKQTYFSCYHIRPDTAPAYLDAIRDARPVFIAGFPSAMALLASFALELQRSDVRFSMFLPYAEPFSEAQRAMIAEAFGAKSRGSYGLAEMCGMAIECDRGGLHIEPEYGVIEIVDADGHPAPDGRIGEIVCTGLLNHAMPLIRYRTGDLGHIDPEPCPCGKPMRVLHVAEGRLDDAINTPSGRIIGRLSPAFKGILGLREAQIVQDAPDGVTIRAVATPEFTEQEKSRLIAQAREYLDEMAVRIELVDRLERTKSGKVRMVINQLARPGARA